MIERCRQAAEGSPPTIDELVALLREGDVDEATLRALRLPDPHHPYGRRVLFATDTMEAMLATWNREWPCAPHDHGGSEGAVRVVRGRCLHQLWRTEGGRLVLEHEELRVAGDVIVAEADLVHSMGDAGGEEALITLHAYVGPIEHMVVWDVPGRRTLVVDGGCGAWIPHDDPPLVRRIVAGLVPRRGLQAALLG